MSRIDMRNDFQHSLSVSLLGCSLLVRCKHLECAKGIAEYYSGCVSGAWCSPDVVVDCDWDAAGRYLFRSRPPAETGPLLGVWVQTPGYWEEGCWPHTDPPIPPFVVEPFRNRFVGLHGAAVRTPNGNCLLVLGEHGSGKTTVTVNLVNNLGCRLLTDETVCVHRRTSLVEPFPRPMGIWQESKTGIVKIVLPTTQVCNAVAGGPAVATHVIFLEKSTGRSDHGLFEITAAEAFRMFQNHQVTVGSTPDEGIVTLAQLARRLRSGIFRYEEYDRLVSCVSEFLAFSN